MIPRAAEQQTVRRNYWACLPQLLSPRAAEAKARVPGARGLCPAAREAPAARGPRMRAKSSPPLTAPREAAQSNEDPNAAKKNK